MRETTRALRFNPCTVVSATKPPFARRGPSGDILFASSSRWRFQLVLSVVQGDRVETRDELWVPDSSQSALPVPCPRNHNLGPVKIQNHKTNAGTRKRTMSCAAASWQRIPSMSAECTVNTAMGRGLPTRLFALYGYTWTAGKLTLTSSERQGERLSDIEFGVDAG